MSAIETIELTANGLHFAARAAGDGPLVLCLHGFPDSAHSWGALLPQLAAAGYRAVAPFMRGYAPTAVPAGGDYSAPTLGLDVLGLADALGARRFYIIGHDWGAVAAYAAAAYAPERVIRMVTAAVPPLWCFLANANPRQLRRSWYMGFFHLPWVAGARVARDDCGFVDRLWRDWSPGWDYSEADIAPVKHILARADCRRAALGYYRAMLPALTGIRDGRARRRLLGKLAVPALVIYGAQDGCMGPEMFAGSERRFTAPCTLWGMPAGHFMHREQPELFADRALAFLG